uniref:Uncharacterized protein n=1 Tax=Vitis vinifera TaxID=29760 RepID=A5AMS8_VITVI|nr:hypothetical protein VITISV_015386 [Vitis vinifera]
MEIPHEDQSSHYDHEKDKFAYLSMRDRIELGKRQVQRSQWGSKYALNGDNTYEHTVGECPTIPTMRDMYNYQSSYTSSWNNHPNLTTQPQPQPSMSTSSLEQAILKISKVMEDFVSEQQKINSHLNEKIDNLESSINVRMEGVYNDLSLRIEKVQDSIEKLTNLDIARGKRKLPPQPHHNLQGTNAKRSRKVLKSDTLVGDCYDNSMDQPSIENHKVQDDKRLLEPFKASTSPGKGRETNSLGPNGKDANFVWDPGGIQHEVGVWFNLLNSKSTSHEVPLPSSLFSIQTLRTMFISVGGRDEEELSQMDFGVQEVVAEASQALLAAPEMAPEMELEMEPARITPRGGFYGAGFTRGETTFGRGGSEVGSGTVSPRGTFLRLEGEEDLAPLVRAISGCRNLAGKKGQFRSKKPFSQPTSQSVSQLRIECHCAAKWHTCAKIAFAIAKYPAEWNFGFEIRDFHALSLRSRFAAVNWGLLCCEVALVCQTWLRSYENFRKEVK